MQCPRCTRPDLARAVRQEVEVDFCPSCLGVWFDRGEVEKVFNRLSAVDPDDLPQSWEPLQRELAPLLFAALVDLGRVDGRRLEGGQLERLAGEQGELATVPPALQ